MRRLRVGDTVQLKRLAPHALLSLLRSPDVGVVVEVPIAGGSTAVRVRFWSEPTDAWLIDILWLELASSP